ncbi:F-box only 7 isoform X1 [Pelobates cultripes]|uniref:F-box only protein 7 n=4 Tax=Pelobates cultripes TaxID=61616 RepID=A0AAD1RUA1_PELCU|nr:F-box only 7 isoform X1 [Pelobates cultripes]
MSPPPGDLRAHWCLKMKLRVRVWKQTCRLELDEENPTLGDLRSKVSASLLPSLSYSNEVMFTITLNGSDALTDDQNTLKSYGIISGDLIIVLLPDSLRPVDASLHLQDQPGSVIFPESCASSSNTTYKRQKSQDDNMTTGVHGTFKAMARSPGSEQEDFPGEQFVMEEGTSSPWEPMLCSEAVDGKIPHSLEKLYHMAECTNANDALIVVLHLLMLETGYIQQGAETKTLAIPEQWRGQGVYKLHYSHPMCDEGSVTLSCVPMGKLIVVNGTLKINNEMKSVKRLQVSTDLYISFPQQDNNVASVYKDLQKLSRLFKDQLVYPLLAATRQVLNLPDMFGLVVLPLELKLRVFRLLDVQSLLSLSASCRELCADTEDPSLWRFFYMRDFRDPIPRSQDTDWKELYKKKHRQKWETLRSRRMIFIPPVPHPLPFHPSPYYPSSFPPPSTFPPGIIGGEYDERPVLPLVGDPITSLIPGISPTSGRFHPFRPHFDPVGTLADPNPTLQGRSGPRPSRGRGHDTRRAFI